MHKLSETIKRKFIDVIELDDWQIETPSGWHDCTYLNRTIEYEVFEVKFESGNSIRVADTHIFIDEFGNEVFAKNSLNVNISSRYGNDKVVSVLSTDEFENMYDVTVESDEHTFYSNDIVSHNTTSVAAYILYYILFSDNVPTVAIVGHKAAGAREVMQRLQLMYEYLPKWMQKGIKTWNKGNIVLEGDNGADGAQVFTGATTASGLRSKSCVTGNTKICVEENESIYYVEIDTIINNSVFAIVKEHAMKVYTVYKLTNLINNKIYIGFHSIEESKIKVRYDGVGSVYKDGYMGSGKHIVRAIKKYGPEKFKQEILEIFDTKELAENFERSIVDKDFTLRDDTYNINIGGNVRIAYGKNTGFYGKHHTAEVKNKIGKLHKNNKYFSNANNFKILHVETQTVYLDMRDAMRAYNIDTKTQLRRLVWEGKFQFVDDKLQKEAIEYFESLLTREERSELLANLARERFTGIPQTIEHAAKRGAAQSEWIKNNPELHSARMNKINKNPEKIAKTAKTHTGMKRSDAAKLNMSNNSATKGKPAKNKSKILAYNPITNEQQWFEKSNDIPMSWIKGAKNKGGPKQNSKCYNNGLVNKMFMNDPGEGWILGRIKL